MKLRQVQNKETDQGSILAHVESRVVTVNPEFDLISGRSGNTGNEGEYKLLGHNNVINCLLQGLYEATYIATCRQLDRISQIIRPRVC